MSVSRLVDVSFEKVVVVASVLVTIEEKIFTYHKTKKGTGIQVKLILYDNKSEGMLMFLLSTL
jgi:hypothetical protein